MIGSVIATIFTSLLSSGAPGLIASLLSPWVKQKFIEDPQAKRTLAEREQEHIHRMAEMDMDIKRQLALKDIDYKATQDINVSNEILQTLELDKLRQSKLFVGIAWVDAISALVRPVLTYAYATLWLMFFFYFGREFVIFTTKAGLAESLIHYAITPETFNIIIHGFWDMFANIIGYWFGMRDTLRNKK
jgi:hypothetical protein